MKMERTPPIMQQVEKISIGKGTVNSAIGAESTVENLAKTLQMPNAVPVSATGNNFGVPR